MSQIKVSSRFPEYISPAYFRKKKMRGGVSGGTQYCKACGKPLSDEISRRRGYGKTCWKERTVIIVLDIQAEESTTIGTK